MSGTNVLSFTIITTGSYIHTVAGMPSVTFACALAFASRSQISAVHERVIEIKKEEADQQ